MKINRVYYIRVDQWIEPCIRVNTRELDRVHNIR